MQYNNTCSTHYQHYKIVVDVHPQSIRTTTSGRCVTQFAKMSTGPNPIELLTTDVFTRVFKKAYAVGRISGRHQTCRAHTPETPMTGAGKVVALTIVALSPLSPLKVRRRSTVVQSEHTRAVGMCCPRKFLVIDSVRQMMSGFVGAVEMPKPQSLRKVPHDALQAGRDANRNNLL